MSSAEPSESPAEPSEPVPAGLLYVPVRSGPAGCTARYFRTPLGGRTAVGFTSAARLAATLGPEQAAIRLSEPALRALAAPLGVTALTVDPQFSAAAPARRTANATASTRATAAVSPKPSAAAIAAANPEPAPSWRRLHPQHIGALRVTGAAAAVACLNLLIG
ncbi:SAV_915 family protein [Streptomyces hokutonensis]|uniref:SAV_915 family protein n=1 Tax=Streptomyces hokutonensis TaxID=1306990 RepID=UPI0003791C02|nr:SAV_915 family protein [Streptomyces hokutonensis]